MHYSTVPTQPLPVALHQVQHVGVIRQPGRELVLVDVVGHQGPPHTKVYWICVRYKSKVLPNNDRQEVALNAKLRDNHEQKLEELPGEDVGDHRPRPGHQQLGTCKDD